MAVMSAIIPQTRAQAIDRQHCLLRYTVNDLCHKCFGHLGSSPDCTPRNASTTISEILLEGIAFNENLPVV